MRIKQHLIILALIIVFPFDVYSHTVVEGKCDDATIYEYNSETTQNNESILLETDNYILTLQHRSDVWDIHDLKIAPKTNPDQTALFQFEGPVFEIITLELDNTALGKEFMVIDKPSARGYRYSLIPSPHEKTTNPNLHIWALWSLPEHDYPMFTDLNNDQVCEILTFDEDYVIAFKYPSFMVTSNAYQFEAISGQLSLDSALTHQHIQSQWEDELYQYNRIMNSIGNAKRKEDIHLQIYEFQLETIFATRFLYTAKQVGEFPEAIAKLKHLILEFEKLDSSENLKLMPFYWSIWGEISFDDFREMNRDTKIFSDQEMQDMKLIFAMVQKRLGTG